jgi:hypothetical protein
MLNPQTLIDRQKKLAAALAAAGLDTLVRWPILSGLCQTDK